MKTKILLTLLLVAQVFLAKAQKSDDAYASNYGSGNISFTSFSLKHHQNYQVPYFSVSQFNNTGEEAPKHLLVKTGKILTFVGLPLIIIGAIMVADADELYYHCVNGDCEGDPKGGFGSIILTSGIGLSGTGVVLWTIGNNKSR